MYEPPLTCTTCPVIASGRYGKAEEVAELVGFLASTNATYLLGENVVIDGGYVIR